MTLAGRLATKLSRITSSSVHVPLAEEREGFRRAQRLAYQCALGISKELKEGWTERETATLMDTFLMDHGVRTFFHKSFAWFGDRTRFSGFTKYAHFMPSTTRLKEDDVIILDTAPVFEQYAGDIGYTTSLKPNPALDIAKERLLKFRRDIPGFFESEMTPSQIWARVDQELKESGYDNIHSMYPFAVLGHRMHRMPLSNLPGIAIPFSLHSYWALLSRGLFPELLSPDHEGEKIGVWAIEPHLGGAGFGAKFEEILVVEKDRCYWLDDQVPHLMESHL